MNNSFLAIYYAGNDEFAVHVVQNWKTVIRQYIHINETKACEELFKISALRFGPITIEWTDE